MIKTSCVTGDDVKIARCAFAMFETMQSITQNIRPRDADLSMCVSTSAETFALEVAIRNQIT